MSKKAEVKSRRKRTEKIRKITSIGALILGILIVVGAAAVLVWPKGPARPNASGMFAGDPLAPVKVQVFSDYQ